MNEFMIIKGKGRIGMMMKGLFCIVFFTLHSSLFTSCDDYLDVLPDNRAALDSEDKITDLLISAYPETSDFMLAEMYSDNTDRNEGPGLTALTVFQEEAAEWKDVTAISQGTPYALWDHCYKAIAAANSVIIAIDKMGRPAHLNGQLGEALLCRAFCHFKLSNIFCLAYSPLTCNKDLGMPYVTAPDSEVSPVYPRGTMAELYANIARDIEEGLPLIDDNLHDIQKYHFNTRAAHAFAARFYLYYMKDDKSNLDKVIEHASQVLGSNPLLVLRDWQALGKITMNDNQRAMAFVNVEDRANLLIMSTKSYWWRIYRFTSLSLKYTHNEKIATTETVNSKGFWGQNGSMTPTFYFDVYVDGKYPKVFMDKLPEFMQITDQVKQTGTVHMMDPIFTTDALIIDRAEAYALKGDYANAYQDLTTWMHSFTKNAGTVDATLLNKTYGDPAGIGVSVPGGMTTDGMEYYTPNNPTPKKRLNPDFTITPGEQENLIHAILHARRVTTIHEGQRWQDIKRYGIEIYRRNIKDDNVTVYDTMKKEDPRRAIQLPSQVINAGIEANPRN